MTMSLFIGESYQQIGENFYQGKLMSLLYMKESYQRKNSDKGFIYLWMQFKTFEPL